MILYWNLAWFLLDNQFSLLNLARSFQKWKSSETIIYMTMMFLRRQQTTNPFEMIVANVTEWEVSEEELEFNSDYSYDYDTDSSNDE